MFPSLRSLDPVLRPIILAILCAGVLAVLPAEGGAVSAPGKTPRLVHASGGHPSPEDVPFPRSFRTTQDPDSVGAALGVDPDAPLAEQLEPALSRVERRLSEWVAALPLLAVALSVFAAFAVLAYWLGRWDFLFDRLSPNVFIRNVLRQGARALLLLVGLLLAVEVLGLTTLVGAVLGGAGIFGVALGFAFKDIVENYLAGVLLSLRQPFSPNDEVFIEDQRGKVVRLTSRETILMSPDGNHVRIPNATVFRSVMVNYTRNPRRRFEVRLTVAQDTELREALATGLAVLRRMKGVLDDPAPAGRVVDVGDSWITLAWYGWMSQETADFGKVRSEAIRLVLDGLGGAGVSMPPPEHLVRLVRTPITAGAAVREPSAPPPPEPQMDVSVDTAVDAQIAEDRKASGEMDLLEPEEA